MRKRILVFAPFIALLLLIVGVVFYLQIPVKTPAVVQTTQATPPVTGKEGSLKTVTTPPAQENITFS